MVTTSARSDWSLGPDESNPTDPITRWYRLPLARRVAAPLAKLGLSPVRAASLSPILGVAAGYLLLLLDARWLGLAVLLFELRGLLGRLGESNGRDGLATLRGLGERLGAFPFVTAVAWHVHLRPPQLGAGVGALLPNAAAVALGLAVVQAVAASLVFFSGKRGLGALFSKSATVSAPVEAAPSPGSLA